MLPSQFLELSRLDKATCIAFIQEKIRVEKEQEKEMKKNRVKKRGK
jgi:hypothetical protein